MEITEMASAPNSLKTTVIVISAHSPLQRSDLCLLGLTRLQRKTRYRDRRSRDHVWRGSL